MNVDYVDKDKLALLASVKAVKNFNNCHLGYINNVTGKKIVY